MTFRKQAINLFFLRQIFKVNRIEKKYYVRSHKHYKSIIFHIQADSTSKLHILEKIKEIKLKIAAKYNMKKHKID